MKTQRTAFGFTLIELLVTISLIGVLLTVGIASYIDFSRRQAVSQAARKIVQDLRLAQSLAANNQKPGGVCSTLTLKGYNFEISNNTYYINVDCSGAPPYEFKTFPPLSADMVLTGFTQIKFKVLRQTLECNRNPCELTVSGFGKSKKIIVGFGGVIKIEGD